MALLAKRVETYFEGSAPENLEAFTQKQLSEFLCPVMEERFHGAGKWENAPIHRVLTTLIRRRPRDLIKLCTLAARHAEENGRNKITSKDLEAIFEEYSQGRLQDTYNEYRSELPHIQRLIEGMRPTTKELKSGEGWIYTTDGLNKKLANICQQGAFLYANGGKATPKNLAQFLYKINFLVARKNDSINTELIDRKFFEENRYISSEFRDFGYDWEVHPAFRKGLQPERGFSLPAAVLLSKD